VIPTVAATVNFHILPPPRLKEHIQFIEHAEALAVMVAVTTDFVFNRWDLDILPYYRILHNHGASVIMQRALKR
jgi:hypothetical protein